jgi:pimeloyl-ACP methyl ester carboxylesterase
MYFTTGCNILMVDYRGYGNSAGSPSEKGLMLDAQACLDYLLRRDDIDHRKIFVFGQSLGGGVAINLAHQNQDKVCGLIVENTFSSVDDMVLVLAARMGYARWPRAIRLFLYFFMTSHWWSKKLVSSIRTPILFIAGLADELIPTSQMRELSDLAVSSRDKQFVGIEGGEHNTTYIQGGHHYFEAMSGFISRLVA